MRENFWIIPWLVLFFAVAIALPVAALLRGKQRELTARRMLVAWTAALFVSGAIAFAIGLVGAVLGQPFAAIHTWYVWLTCGPLLLSLGIAFAVAPKAVRAGRGMLAGLLLASLTPALVGFYASFIEPYWLDVTHTRVPLAALASDAEPIRVVVLADLQTREIDAYEERVRAQIEALAPDIILLPGDFHQSLTRDFATRQATFRDYFASLNAPYGVYACLGNIDTHRVIAPLFDGIEARLLVDEIAVVNVRGTRVAIGGTRYTHTDRHNPPLLNAMAAVDADVKLLMAHAPDAVLGAEQSDDVDLIISGHTHGGQVQIPGFGPLATASDVPRHIAGGGLHQHSEQFIYVSRGVGMECHAAPPLRLFCRPELACLDLVATSKTGADSPLAATAAEQP